MKTLSPMGGAYIVDSCPENTLTRNVSQCIVVFAISRGLAFSAEESMRSFFHHNKWVTDVLVYYESAGEQAMTLPEVSFMVRQAVEHQPCAIRYIECERNGAVARPFVGPKVCTYTAASRANAKVFMFLDLDLWHFLSCLTLIPRAAAGSIVCVAEADTGTLYREMFEAGGIYNGTPEDTAKYPDFIRYSAVFSHMDRRNLCLNSGLLIINSTTLLATQQIMQRTTFVELADWMFEKKDAFTGNREQALLNLVLLQTGVNIHWLGSEWNFQLVKGHRVYPRPDGRLAAVSAAPMPIHVLHFNGFAAPDGPARLTHAKLLSMPETLQAAGLPQALGGTLAEVWPKL